LYQNLLHSKLACKEILKDAKGILSFSEYNPKQLFQIGICSIYLKKYKLGLEIFKFFNSPEHASLSHFYQGYCLLALNKLNLAYKQIRKNIQIKDHYRKKTTFLIGEYYKKEKTKTHAF